jgi:hypothetical protein
VKKRRLAEIIAAQREEADVVNAHEVGRVHLFTSNLKLSRF